MLKLKLTTVLTMIILFTGCQSPNSLEARNKPDSTFASMKVGSTSDEEELIRLQREWLSLETKHAAVGHFMADGYSLVTSDGTVITKAQMINFVQSDDFPFTSMTPENLKVQVYGDVAVVKGLIKWSNKNNKNGQFLFTDTWLKRDGRWQCIATHESGAKETTVGNYELSPEMKKLAAFLGEWIYEGEQVDPPVSDIHAGGAGKFSGTITTRAILGGQFMEEKYEEKNPAGTSSFISIIGYDVKTEKYIKNYYFDDGSRETSVLTASADGKTWTINSNTTTSSGNNVLFHSAIEFTADSTRYTGATQGSSDNGKTWKHWYRFVANKNSN